MKVKLNTALTYLIAMVWVGNGLFCKLLNLVPRHEQIVARILGNTNAWIITKSIGILEILMAIWILSRVKPRLNAMTQILVVATMNVIEFFLASDLLLWGKFNSIYALLFILVVYCNEFALNKNLLQRL